MRRKTEFDQQIQSVFENEDYVGYIINNSANPEKGKYILQVYNKRCQKVKSYRRYEL